MTKKIIFLAIAFALLTNSTFANFQDLKDENPYKPEIEQLQENGYIKTDATLFFPSKTISKEDLYKMIIEYANFTLPQEDEVNILFTDVEKNNIYSPYIRSAIKNNLIENKKIEFGIKKPLTKYETLNILFDTFGISQNYFEQSENFNFSDLNENSTFNEIAQISHKIGIKENDETQFKMYKNVTKDEMYHYLYLTNKYLIETNTPSKPVEYEISSHQEYYDFIETYDILSKKYYYKDKINEKDLIINAIDGMVSSIDDQYTDYQNPKEAEAFIQTLNSNYEGIGVILDSTDDGFLKIISIFDNSPAKTAGLKENDVIIKINSTDIEKMAIDKAVQLIKGEVNTYVNLTIKRNSQILVIKVKREKININEVSSEIKNVQGKEIVYIKIPLFANTTYSEFLKNMEETTTDKTQGILIDVRNNPGGLIDQANSIIALFSKKDAISVITENANGNQVEYHSKKDGAYKDIKTVILINQGSASASEILAGALKENNSSTIVGSKSFGKGSVQELRLFSNGSMIKFTSAAWLTPNKNSIEHIGITPDILINDDPNTENDEQLEKALNQF